MVAAGGKRGDVHQHDHHDNEPKVSRFGRLFGFELAQLGSWRAFTELLHRPMDPSSLAVMRVMFGLIMVLDIPLERGLAFADERYGDPSECRFPLFDSLQPLPIAWMYVVYLVMILGALGMMLGFLYRWSCLMFVVTYWYVFSLDKTLWNNHSYLFGLFSIILMVSDANRYWSVDALIWPQLNNSHVPLWNYTLLRTQLFIVYFYAGLKKLDPDWVMGYSMVSLSNHWVFDPFKVFMTHAQIDLILIHLCGLGYDLSVGYLLFFDYTRPVGIGFSLMFHTMNSQIFSIGMFPWTMIATLPLFCYVDWPKKLLLKLPQVLQRVLPSANTARFSPDCDYPQEGARKKPVKNVSHKRRLSTLLTVCYILTQLFLPYSHFITKGYTNWTNGLYGYSWDMMVHSWSTQHMRITYVNKVTGELGYLKTDAYTHGQKRWSSHADMVKQHADCIQERLKSHDMHDVELYFDIWRSLNDRFQQRMFDPRVNIMTAPWSPWRETPWLMPLLLELSDWRYKMESIENEMANKSADIQLTFMADFPGLTVENYMQDELGNPSIEVLKGEVIVELLATGKNHTLQENDRLELPTGEFHNIHTISDTPSCFMYIYINKTDVKLTEALIRLEEGDTSVPSDPADADLLAHVQLEKEKLTKNSNMTMWDKFSNFIKEKYQLYIRSANMISIALRSIATGQDFFTVADPYLINEAMDE